MSERYRVIHIEDRPAVIAQLRSNIEMIAASVEGRNPSPESIEAIRGEFRSFFEVNGRFIPGEVTLEDRSSGRNVSQVVLDPNTCQIHRIIIADHGRSSDSRLKIEDSYWFSNRGRIINAIRARFVAPQDL